MTSYEFPHTINTTENDCPQCHSSDFTCIDDGPEDDYYFYEYECEECGTIWREWYTMHYSETVYVTKEEQQAQDRKMVELRQRMLDECNNANKKAWAKLEMQAELTKQNVYLRDY